MNRLGAGRHSQTHAQVNDLNILLLLAKHDILQADIMMGQASSLLHEPQALGHLTEIAGSCGLGKP